MSKSKIRRANAQKKRLTPNPNAPNAPNAPTPEVVKRPVTPRTYKPHRDRGTT